MAISRKIRDFSAQSSWIRKMFEEGIKLKAEKGADNVFDFTLGNPNLEPPEKFKKTLIEVASDPAPGGHAYMPNAGIMATREAIAGYLSQVHSVKLSGANIIITCGAGGGLNVVLKTLLNYGDEVLYPAPFFVEYRFYADNHGGVGIPVRSKDDFSLDLEAFESAMTNRTKAIIINSPNNPTGKVLSRESLKDLADLLRRKSQEFGKEIYIISDEPYRDIVYDNVEIPSILMIYENSFVVSSYSKDLSIPGERIGYIAANPGMTKLQDTMDGLVLCNRILGFVNAPALMQRVIGKIQGVKVDAGIYKRKRDLFCKGLAECGYDLIVPEGAFYLFPRSPIADDVEFTRALLEENILVVPGSGFGGPGHIRIAYCVADSVIEKAIPGFRRVMKKYQAKPWVE
jgi:aspartate aminotransferase